MHRGQPVQQGEGRQKELVQSGKRHVCLELDSARSKQPHLARLRGRMLEEGSLADPGFSSYHQTGAPAQPGRGQCFFDRATLGIAADQHRYSLSNPLGREELGGVPDASHRAPAIRSGHLIQEVP